MNDICSIGEGVGVDCISVGIHPAVLMQNAKMASDVTAATTAAIKMDIMANGEIEPGVIRPLQELPGWFVYRSPDRYDAESGNIQQVVLALRSDAVNKFLGYVPESSTLVLDGQIKVLEN